VDALVMVSNPLHLARYPTHEWYYFPHQR
jgi:hypothetical protein